MKRTLLLIGTNLAILLVLGVVSTLTGAHRVFTGAGLDALSDWRMACEQRHPVRPVAPPADCWLVALDGSGHALQALAAARRLATESGVNTFDLATVHDWLSTEAAETELALRGWATTAEARAKLDASGFGWRLHVLMGEPAVGIVEQAGALGSRGIVIGARGLTAFDGLLMGSVAQQVLHTARGAVLVVRGSASFKE